MHQVPRNTTFQKICFQSVTLKAQEKRNIFQNYKFNQNWLLHMLLAALGKERTEDH